MKYEHLLKGFLSNLQVSTDLCPTLIACCNFFLSIHKKNIKTLTVTMHTTNRQNVYHFNKSNKLGSGYAYVSRVFSHQSKSTAIILRMHMLLFSVT